jgi:hypothetical protein
MKNQVKKFSQYIKESDEFEMDDDLSLDGGIANVYLSTSMSGEFATINFNGEEANVDEEESLRKTWQKILNTAMRMGASGIYSVEDGEIITKEDIMKFDDSPSGW